MKIDTYEANSLLLQSPFAPLAEVVGEDNLTSIFDNVGGLGSNPFSGTSSGGSNPFSGGAGDSSPFGGSGSFGGSSGGSGGDTGSSGGESGSSSGSSSEDINQLLSQSPFGRLSEVLGDDLSSIFSGVSGGSGENPFGGASGGMSSNSDLPYGGNPFAGENFNTIFGGGSSGGGSNPFSGSSSGSSGGGSNPFSGSSSGSSGGGSNPFSGSSSGSFMSNSSGESSDESSGESSGAPTGFSGGSGGSNPFSGGSGGSNPFSSGSGGSNPFSGGSDSSNPFSGSNPFLDGMSLVSSSDAISVEGDSQLTIRGVNLITTDAANDSGGSPGETAPISGGSNNQTDFAGINNIVLGNDVQFGVGNDIVFDVQNSNSPASEEKSSSADSPYAYDFSANGGPSTGGTALIGGANNDNYFAGINNLIMGTDIQFAVGDRLKFEIINKGSSDSETVLGGSNNRNYFAGINNLILGSNINYAVGEDMEMTSTSNSSTPASMSSDNDSNGGITSTQAGNGQQQEFVGIDTMLMGTSNDELINGGAGGAMLMGGGGADDFMIANGSFPQSPSTIADFEIGSDKIKISGLADVSKFEDLSLTAESNGTMISAGDQKLAFLSNISTNDLAANSFTIDAV
jgi:hypothetical protein